MQYDLSQIGFYSNDPPLCYIPSDIYTGIILFGEMPTNVSGSLPVALQDGVVLPLAGQADPYTGSAPRNCILLSDLKHSQWVQIAFPALSIFSIVFILSMIYHIIFKRLMP